MRGHLLVFSGIDGAGKSTQIERVAQLLETTGRVPNVLWARGGYTSGMNAAKTCIRRAASILRAKHRSIPASGPSKERTEAFANPLVRKLWLTFSILDLIRVYAINVRCKLLFGGTVLCDRYYQDTLLDFELHHSSENVSNWLCWRLLQRLSPKPDLAFLLLVPTKISQQRSIEKNEPFPTPDEILKARLAAYQSWSAADETWQVVDGTLSVDQVTNMIVTAIRSECPGLSLDPFVPLAAAN